MKKPVKIILWAVAILIAIPVVLVCTMPLWLGTVVRPTVNAVAPKFTKTEFNIGKLWLNPYTGRFELGNMVVGNPQGYAEPTAVAISNIVVDVAMGTLADKYVHVEDIVVDQLFVSYVTGGEYNVDNVTQIQYNIAGGKEKYEQKQAAKSAEPQKPQETQAAEPTGAESGKKLVIDHLLIRGVSLKYGMVTIPVPTIELRDLGKETDGLTVAEFVDAVWQAILKSALAIGDGVKAAVSILGNGAKDIGGALKGGAAGAGEAMDKVGKEAGKAVDAIQGLFK